MVTKLISRIKYRNMVLFICVLLLMGFLFGIFYYLRLNNGVRESLLPGLIYLKDNLLQSKMNFILIHLFIGISILLLSITVIGLPIVYFYLFFESLSIGFSMSTIISAFGIKGFLFSFLYFLIYKFGYLLLIIYLTMRSSRLTKNMIGFLIYRDNEYIKSNILINIRKLIVILFLIFIFDVLVYCFSPIINKLLIIFL